MIINALPLANHKPCPEEVQVWPAQQGAGHGADRLQHHLHGVHCMACGSKRGREHMVWLVEAFVK